MVSARGLRSRGVKTSTRPAMEALPRPGITVRVLGLRVSGFRGSGV